MSPIESEKTLILLSSVSLSRVVSRISSKTGISGQQFSVPTCWNTTSCSSGNGGSHVLCRKEKNKCEQLLCVKALSEAIKEAKRLLPTTEVLAMMKPLIVVRVGRRFNLSNDQVSAWQSHPKGANSIERKTWPLLYASGNWSNMKKWGNLFKTLSFREDALIAVSNTTIIIRYIFG